MEALSFRVGFILLAVLCLVLLLLYKMYHNPFKKLLQKAQQGDPQAKYELGKMFYTGRHTRQDHAQAFAWFLSAAQNGCTPAMTALAGLYHAGYGCVRDEEKAQEYVLNSQGARNAGKIQVSAEAVRNSTRDPERRSQTRKVLQEDPGHGKTSRSRRREGLRIDQDEEPTG